MLKIAVVRTINVGVNDYQPGKFLNLSKIASEIRYSSNGYKILVMHATDPDSILTANHLSDYLISEQKAMAALDVGFSMDGNVEYVYTHLSTYIEAPIMLALVVQEYLAKNLTRYILSYRENTICMPLLLEEGTGVVIDLEQNTYSLL